MSAEKGGEDSSDTDTAFTVMMAVVVWRVTYYTINKKTTKKMHEAENPRNEITQNWCQRGTDILLSHARPMNFSFHLPVNLVRETFKGQILSKNRAAPRLRSWVTLFQATDE